MKLYVHNSKQKLVAIIQENGSHRVYHNYRTKNTTHYHSRKFTQESTLQRLLSFGYKSINEVEFRNLLNKSTTNLVNL